MDTPKHQYSGFRRAMVAVVLGSAAWSAQAAQDITGFWRAIDDRTGFARAIVRIDRLPDATYSGTVAKILPRPGYVPKEVCVNCPAPYTSQKILGMTNLQGLVQQADGDGYQYTRGKILDPLTGTLYNCKMKLSDDGRRLNLRGFKVASMLGRSQGWVRETDAKLLAELQATAH